jgi:t-SNARE complex subunit (syntaxin)
MHPDERRSLISSTSSTSYESDEEVHDLQLNEQIQNELTFNHAIVDEQRQFVQEMYQNMVDVQEMMEDLSMTIRAQRPQLDEIEVHVTETRGNAEAALEEISRASELQRRARNKTCCMTLLYAGLVLVACAFLVKVVAG